MRNKPVKFASFAIMLLFLAIGPVYAASNVSTATPPAMTDFPFDATGLTAHPHETAEEILARAHQGDARATILVIVGYLQGIGGFPQDNDLATNFFDIAMQFLFVDAIVFTHLADYPSNQLTDMKLASRLRSCDYLQNNAVLETLRVNNLFNPAPLCVKWKGVAESRPKVIEIAYNKKLKGEVALQQEFVEIVKELRQIQVDSFTEKEHNLLKKAEKYFHPKVILFYTVTSHNPETEAPQWNLPRLLGLRNTLRKRKEPSVKAYAEEAEALLLFKLTDDNTIAEGIIKAAHTGDVKAMRKLSQLYYTGEMGFPPSKKLAITWLYRAVAAGDKTGILGYMVLEDYSPLEIWVQTREIENQSMFDAADIKLLKAMQESAEKKLGMEEVKRLKGLSRNELKKIVF